MKACLRIMRRMFEDNEEQHIFTFRAFIKHNLHQYAGKTLYRITTSVIIIIHYYVC